MDLREIDRQTGRKTYTSNTLFPCHERIWQRDNHQGGELKNKIQNNFCWLFQFRTKKSMCKPKAIIITHIDSQT